MLSGVHICAPLMAHLSTCVGNLASSISFRYILLPFSTTSMSKSCGMVGSLSVTDLLTYCIVVLALPSSSSTFSLAIVCNFLFMSGFASSLTPWFIFPGLILLVSSSIRRLVICSTLSSVRALSISSSSISSRPPSRFCLFFFPSWFPPGFLSVVAIVVTVVVAVAVVVSSPLPFIIMMSISPITGAFILVVLEELVC